MNFSFEPLIHSVADEEQEVVEQEIFKFKIIVLGAAAVGKSSLLYQYTKQRNPQFETPTIGTDFVSKVVQKEQIECHLQIWDTADYTSPSIPSKLFNNAVGFIIVYDITSKKSFDSVLTIMNDLVNKGEINKEVFLVGTKSDREKYGERQVSKAMVQSFVKNRKLNSREVSCKQYFQIEKLFDDLIQNIIQKINSNCIRKQTVLDDRNSQKIVLGGQGFQKRYNRCI